MDPTLTRVKIAIDLTASDGYKSNWLSSPHTNAPPKQCLMNGIEELARLTSLYGFEAEALEAFNCSRERVAKWKIKRGTDQYRLALRDAVAALGGIQSENVPATVRAALGEV